MSNKTTSPTHKMVGFLALSDEAAAGKLNELRQVGFAIDEQFGDKKGCVCTRPNGIGPRQYITRGAGAPDVIERIKGIEGFTVYGNPKIAATATPTN